MLSQLGSEPLAKLRASSLPFFLSPKIAHSYHKSRVPDRGFCTHQWSTIVGRRFIFSCSCGEALLFVQFLELVKVFISTCVGWMEIHNWTKLLLNIELNHQQESNLVLRGLYQSVHVGHGSVEVFCPGVQLSVGVVMIMIRRRWGWWSWRCWWRWWW